MQIVNIIPAALLFILVSIIVYITWYILYGRARKERKALENAAGKKKDKEPAYADETYGKDSYCYPKINDVMGYEFVSVVRVPEELLKDDEPEEEESWEKSTSLGLTAVKPEDENEESEDERYYPDDEEIEGLIPNANTVPTFNKKKEEEEPGQKKDEDDEEAYSDTIGSLTFEELEQLNNMDWDDRDYDPQYTEEEVETIIRNNPDRINEPTEKEKEEAAKIAREQEMLAGMQFMQDALIGNGSQADEDELEQILNAIPDDAKI